MSLLLTLSACGDAFRSDSSGGAAAAISVELEFSDGTTQQSLPEGATVAITLWVPRAGHSQLLAPGGGAIDPAFLTLTADPGLGGFTPQDDLAPVLDGLGFIQAGAPDQGRIPVAIDFPLTGNLEAAPGLLTLAATVIDDVGGDSGSLEIQLTVVAINRPTVVMTLEQPPLSGNQPSGLPLPIGGAGDPFIGESLPFVLVVKGIPAPSSGTGFDLLVQGNGVDPARFVVVADQPLGDPMAGGVAAGQNLAFLFGQDLDIVVDPVTGEFTAAMAIARDDPLAPALGRITFDAVITDDDSIDSDPQMRSLQVDPATTLVGDFLPLNLTYCGVTGCHKPPFPTRGLELDTRTGILTTAVLVDASDTDETTSCAANRIQPYDPDASYYMHKVWGSHRDPCVGGAGRIMPPGASKPTPAEIEVLEQWILQGAFDN